MCRKGFLSDGASGIPATFIQTVQEKEFFILFLHLFFKFEIFEGKKKEREREQQAKTPKRIQMRKPTDKCRKWAIV